MKKKVILLFFIMILVPLVMGQRCLAGGGLAYAWRDMIIQGAQMQLDTYYTTQMDNAFALGDWVNANDQYQRDLQASVRQLWGEEVAP